LRAFVLRLRETGWPVTVVTPATNQSFVSKAVDPAHAELELRRGASGEDEDGGSPSLGPPGSVWTVSGFPASCVSVALHHPVALGGPEPFDLVVSGPNLGHNAGAASVLSSGTVGAAMEGALAGVRAVALSFPYFTRWSSWEADHVDAAAAIAVGVVGRLWVEWEETVGDESNAVGGRGGAPPPALWNVNVPLGAGVRDVTALTGGAALAEGDPRAAWWERGHGGPLGLAPVPVVRTRVCPDSGYRRLYRPAGVDDDVAHADPGGGAGPPPEGEGLRLVWSPRGLRVFAEDGAAEGTDVWAIRSGAVSVTGLRAGFEHSQGGCGRGAG